MGTFRGDRCVVLDDLGDRLLEAKRAYFEQRALDDKLFGSRFAPDQ